MPPVNARPHRLVRQADELYRLDATEPDELQATAEHFGSISSAERDFALAHLLRLNLEAITELAAATDRQTRLLADWRKEQVQQARGLAKRLDEVAELLDDDGREDEDDSDELPPDVDDDDEGPPELPADEDGDEDADPEPPARRQRTSQRAATPAETLPAEPAASPERARRARPARDRAARREAVEGEVVGTATPAEDGGFSHPTPEE